MTKKHNNYQYHTTKNALMAILSALFATISKGKRKVLNSDDIEFLHDYRVAIRRTRCLLSQFETAFHKQDIKHFRHEFYWLFGATGKVRDIDVQLSHLQYYQTLGPTLFADDLPLLKEHLLTRQTTARNAMLEVFDSARYQTLLTEWFDFLSTGHPIKSKYADIPIGHVADKRIRMNYLAILKQGRSTTLDAPDEVFHELRKSCKKLRYLLEFFGGFYHDKETDGLINNLKSLQDNLGAHQDLCVQIQFLQESPALKPTARDSLITLLHSEKQKQRGEFAGLFDKFTKHPIPTLKHQG